MADLTTDSKRFKVAIWSLMVTWDVIQWGINKIQYKVYIYDQHDDRVGSM